MNRLDRFLNGEQLDLDALLAEARNSIAPGDRVKSTVNDAFEAVVVSVADGKAKVRVLCWLGPVLPRGPVTCRTANLLVV